MRVGGQTPVDWKAAAGGGRALLPFLCSLYLALGTLAKVLLGGLEDTSVTSVELNCGLSSPSLWGDKCHVLLENLKHGPTLITEIQAAVTSWVHGWGDTVVTRHALAHSAWTLALPSVSLAFYRACSGRITAWKRPEKCMGCPPLPESSLAPLAQPALLLSAFLRLLVFSHSSLRGAATKTSSSHRRGKRNRQELHGREEPCHLPTVRSVRSLFPFCGCTARTE